MLTPHIMIYIMTGIMVLYCICFQYFYGKKICLEFQKIQELSRRQSSARVVPVTTAVLVDYIPRDSVIVTINTEIQQIQT